MTRDQEHEHRQRAQAGAFKVVDRRRFSATGELRPDAPPDAPRPVSPPAPAPQHAAAERSAQTPTQQPHGQRPPKPATSGPRASASSVDFLSFVSSLATNAMAAMGLLPGAQSRGAPPNLNMAREYIEIIVMLQERTQGNLTPDEDHAMTQLIEDLGHQYVALQRAPSPSPGKMPPQM